MFDVYSDIRVAIELFKDCHYAWFTVSICIIAAPQTVHVIGTAVGTFNIVKTLGLCVPIPVITIWFGLQAFVFGPDYDGGGALTRFEDLRMIETYFESYLQLIFSLYILLELGPDNAMFLDIVNLQVMSIILSAMSVLYGLSNSTLKGALQGSSMPVRDRIRANAVLNGFQKALYTMLASMVILLDIALRIVVYDAMFLIFEIFAIAVPATIFILSFIVFKSIFNESMAEAPATSFLSAISYHVPTNIFEKVIIKKTDILRIISNCVCLISIVAMTIVLNTDIRNHHFFKHFNNGTLNESMSCRDICNVASESCEVLYTTTDTLWTMTMVAWLLLALSCIEGAFESCRLPFMPRVILDKQISDFKEIPLESLADI